MPSYPPPDAAPNRAKTTKLPEGTALFRVHPARFGGGEFNSTVPAAAGGGGRFDSPGGRPSYLYAALSPRAAIAEAFLRNLPFDVRGVRQLPGAALVGRRLTELHTTEPLRLVSLHGEGLARLGQDLWLVHCDASEYGDTREWGAAIMRWNPWAAGLAWRPRHDDDGLAICIYEDRCPGAVNVVRTIALDKGEGRAQLHSTLIEFGVALPLDSRGVR